jgi:hypothetical protein
MEIFEMLPGSESAVVEAKSCRRRTLRSVVNNLILKKKVRFVRGRDITQPGGHSAVNGDFTMSAMSFNI